MKNDGINTASLIAGVMVGLVLGSIHGLMYQVPKDIKQSLDSVREDVNSLHYEFRTKEEMEAAKKAFEEAYERQVTVVDEDALNRAVGRAIEARDKSWDKVFHDLLAPREKVIHTLQTQIAKASEALRNGDSNPLPPIVFPADSFPQHEAAPEKPSKVWKGPAKQIPSKLTIDAQLSKSESAILSAFYWIRDEDATPAKIAFYSSYSSGSSTTNNALGTLRRQGLVHGWRITREGIAVAESLDVAEKPSGADLLSWLRGKMVRSEQAMLDALVRVHPRRLSNQELSEASGYSLGSSTFNNAIGKLRTIEAAEGYERDGGVKASDIFFE